MAAHNETLTEAGGKVHRRGVLPDALSKITVEVCPLLAQGRNSKGHRGQKKALAEWHTVVRWNINHSLCAW